MTGIIRIMRLFGSFRVVSISFRTMKRMRRM